MRYKVRAAINSWDLQRLGLDVTQTETEDFEYTFDESDALDPDAEVEFDSLGPST